MHPCQYGQARGCLREARVPREVRLTPEWPRTQVDMLPTPKYTPPNTPSYCLRPPTTLPALPDHPRTSTTHAATRRAFRDEVESRNTSPTPPSRGAKHTHNVDLSTYQPTLAKRTTRYHRTKPETPRSRGPRTGRRGVGGSHRGGWAI